MYTDNTSNPKVEGEKGYIVSKKISILKSFVARSCSYRCWKFNFLMQTAYMNAKNAAKSTRTGATTGIKFMWYPK